MDKSYILMDKSYILGEIRRIGKRDGAPPGEAKFQKETGIRKSDWRGKHWIRWSEALREAGYVPNRMGAAIGRTDLLEKLIALVRKLGRLPVEAELQLEHGKDPSFPDRSVFNRQFDGTARHKLASVLREYCAGRADYNDVITICETVSAPRPVDVPPHVPNDDSFEIVYLLKSGRYYKIGRTNAAGRRKRELRIQLPETAKIIHEIRTDDSVGIERYWHSRFEAKRGNGEWFDLDTQDVNAFRRRTFM